MTHFADMLTAALYAMLLQNLVFTAAYGISESIKIDKDYIVVNNALKQKKFESSCHFCNSKKILLYKGDGEYIDGLDFLGYKCDDCKKVYIFSDIKFKLK